MWFGCCLSVGIWILKVSSSVSSCIQIHCRFYIFSLVNPENSNSCFIVCVPNSESFRNISKHWRIQTLIFLGCGIFSKIIIIIFVLSSVSELNFIEHKLIIASWLGFITGFGRDFSYEFYKILFFSMFCNKICNRALAIYMNEEEAVQILFLGT